MDILPLTGEPLVVRTDFSDDEQWPKLQALIRTPFGPDNVFAEVEFLNDPAYRGLSADTLLTLIPPDCPHGVAILVDEATFRDQEHPVLLVSLDEEDGLGRDFRATPDSVSVIMDNLAVGNMSFEELADLVDPDGVYRA